MIINYRKFYLYFLLLVGIFFYSGTTAQSNTALGNSEINDQVSAYAIRIPSDILQESLYLSSLSFELNALQTTNSLTYLIVNNNGWLEEYIGIEKDQKFIQVSSKRINNRSTANLKIKVSKGIMYINEKLVSGFRKITNFSKLKKVQSSHVCCMLCYLSHDILGIHFMDCLCCFGSCDYDCSDNFEILWSEEK